MANLSFSEYFTLPPDNMNSLALLVSGLKHSFSPLNWIGSVGRTVGAMSSGGNLSPFRRSGEQRLHAAGNTPHSLYIEGFIESLARRQTVWRHFAINAEVSPVPESTPTRCCWSARPDGVVARRRSCR